MTVQKIIDDLPEVYKVFFPGFFLEEIPQESFATCDDCVMCLKNGQQPLPNVRYFSPNVKCCSFHPTLPNYLVGGILADTNPEMDEGRRRIREKIGIGIGITPRGVMQPKVYSAIYDRGMANGFGMSQTLLCPYYIKENGRCSVWQYREAVCTTYFCRSISGQHGKMFWNALKAYLTNVQESLINYTLLKLNWPPAKILEGHENSELMSLEDLEGVSAFDGNFREMWGEWVEKIEDFYIETYHIVKSLSPSRFERVGGIDQVVLLEQLRAVHKEMIEPGVPRKLILNSQLVAQKVDEENYLLIVEMGPVTVTNHIYDILELFDGNRTLEEVRQAVLIYKNATLEDELVAKLFQWGVLLGTDSVETEKIKIF